VNKLIPISEVVKDFIRIEAKVCKEHGWKPGELLAAIVKAETQPKTD